MPQSIEEIVNKIEPSIRAYVDVDGMHLRTVLSNELLTWNRFDLAFKLFYLEIKKFNPLLGKKYYEQHLKSFGLGTIREPDNPLKSSLEDFILEFENIYKSILHNGFKKSISLLPLAFDGSIANGAHRLASAIYLNLDVNVLNVKLPPSRYDYKYFKERNISSEILDLMACTFIEYSKNTYIAFLWPSISGREKEAEDIIPNIVYKKELDLNINGAHNLLTQIYQDESWIGNFENKYSGIKGKVNECFRINKPLTVIAFQADSLVDVINIKNKIRSKFPFGNHSIHITDNSEESKNISRVVFNNNSIHFLNNANPFRFLDNKFKLQLIKRELYNSQTCFKSIVIDGGFVLSLYGIRDSYDVDYISTASIKKIQSKYLKFDNHFNQLTFHRTTTENLIWDPKFYFWFDGLKFVSLKQIYEMKRNRGEIKDEIDCKSILALLSNQSIKLYVARLSQYLLYFKIKSYYFIYICLKNSRLLGLIKKILKRNV